jgi:hypothetical protein
MADMNAESMNTSLVKKDGKLHQHSAQAVVLPLTATDNESLKKQLLVLAALFQALLNNTLSGDARALALYQAVGSLEGVMDEAEVKEIAIKFLSTRRGSAIDGMF